MDSSRPFFFTSLIIPFLLTLTVAQQQPLFNFCLDTSGNFTRNSTYETNLNRLVSSFSSNGANDYGFYNVSSGQGSDRVNAIALCRGDVNSGDCLSCINNATTRLRNLCPNKREAIIWYDSCMFRYTNRSIFGVMETNPTFYMWNLNNVTDVDAFNRALSALMDNLRNNASAGTSLRKFATGSAQVTAFQTIYALVQCTPDLTDLECSSCLSQAIQQIPTCCDRKQGGRVIGPSCNFRFEIDRFYDLTPADIPSTPSPPPPSPLSPPPSNNTTSTTGTLSCFCSVRSTVESIYLPVEKQFHLKGINFLSIDNREKGFSYTLMQLVGLDHHGGSLTENPFLNFAGKKSNSSRNIIIITVSVVASAVLLISSCIFFFLRVRKSKVKASSK